MKDLLNHRVRPYLSRKITLEQTERDLKIAEMGRAGSLNFEIADELNMNRNTVRGCLIGRNKRFCKNTGWTDEDVANYKVNLANRQRELKSRAGRIGGLKRLDNR